MSSDSPLGQATYNQLRRMAAASFRGGDGRGLLQPTALVHEAWMKISRSDQAQGLEREHFLSLAARAMRQILIDEARARQALKRGGGAAQVTLSGVAEGGADAVVDVLAVDAALTRLAEAAPRRAQVVELRYFGGLGMEAIAQVVGASVATVERDWRAARAWLQAQL